VVKKRTISVYWSVIASKLLFILAFVFVSTVQASKNYSPSHVFSAVEYANKIVDKLLVARKISSLQLPHSREKAVKPTHVYELHISILAELHRYAIKNNRRPPPLPVSTPIKYTPTDVYYLTQLAVQNLKEIYEDKGGVIDFTVIVSHNKSPSDVYQKLFELYYKINRLNGKEKITPSEVYSHVYRVVEDLKYSLQTVSMRLDKKQQDKKRFLVTATYGIHPNGTTMSAFESGKTPKEVIEQAFKIRDKLNILRKRYGLPMIRIPSIAEYDKVKPIDVFLQSQFIIADLNLLKRPMKIESSTNRAKFVSHKSPSHVYQQMKHINYMLQRMIDTL